MPIVRAKLVSFASGTYLASIRIDGGTPLAVASVPTSRAIPAAEMVAGRRLIVDTGDTGDLGDCVITAVYA